MVANKPWKQMQDDEKIEHLRFEIEKLAGIIQPLVKTFAAASAAVVERPAIPVTEGAEHSILEPAVDSSLNNGQAAEGQPQQ